MWKNLAEKWKLNLPVLTDWLTSFKICSRFYFADSLLVELKALNIIKSLVIRSMRNKTGLNLGWVFAGFFRWVYQKNQLGLAFLGIYPGFWTLCHLQISGFNLLYSSSSRMRVIYHNWSAMKQRPHPQSVAEISHHSVLSGGRIRQWLTLLTGHDANRHVSLDNG